MIVLVMLISVLSLGFAVFLARQVLAADTGTPQMQDIAAAITEGAEAFLRRQNRTIAVIGLGVAALIFILYAAVRPHNPNDPTTTFNMAIATTLSFVFGALCSHRRLHRHVRLHPGQPPHRLRGALEPQPRAADRAPRRRGLGALRRRHEPARRGRPLRTHARLRRRR